jgi:hypothetical protein
MVAGVADGSTLWMGDGAADNDVEGEAPGAAAQAAIAREIAAAARNWIDRRIERSS